MKMQPSKGTSWSHSIRVGVTALVLSLAVGLPTAAIAKEKVLGAKVSKHKTAKTVAHHTVKTKPKATAKAKIKASKSPNKRVLNAKHQASAHRRARDIDDPLIWRASQEPRQAYYIMPDTLGTNVVSLQPSHLHVSAIQPPPQASSPTSSTHPPAKFQQIGSASYYSDKFHGRKTASGERFDQNGLTCAHGSLPFGCRIRVTNLHNNKAVEVKVNDRGGFNKYNRVIDLSKAAAREIGMLGVGTAKVKVEVLE